MTRANPRAGLARQVAAVAVLALSCLAFTDAQAEDFERTPRTWVDSTGEFEVIATYVGFSDGEVQLKLADGELISVPVRELCRDDKKYVETQLRRRSQRPLVERIPVNRTSDSADRSAEDRGESDRRSAHARSEGDRGGATTRGSDSRRNVDITREHRIDERVSERVTLTPDGRRISRRNISSRNDAPVTPAGEPLQKYGITWHTTAESASEAAAEFGDVDRPIMWFRVLGDLEGFM